MIKLNYIKKNGRLKRKPNNEIENMSYSTWQNSKFYTYWSPLDAQYKEDEVFKCYTSVDRLYQFTYIECTELVENLTNLKGKINEIEGDDDAIELRGYMREFISSVDGQYEKV
jgi:hypothetical protein